MGIAISQVVLSLEPCFYARSIVRMVVRRLMKKHSSSNELNREIVILILLLGYPFYPHRLCKSFLAEQLLPRDPCAKYGLCQTWEVRAIQFFLCCHGKDMFHSNGHRKGVSNKIVPIDLCS